MPSRYTEDNSTAFGVSPTKCSWGHVPKVQCGLLSPQFPSWLCMEPGNAETGNRKPCPSSSTFTLRIYICTYRGEWYLLNSNLSFTRRTLVLSLQPAGTEAKLLGVENRGREDSWLPKQEQGRADKWGMLKWTKQQCVGQRNTLRTLWGEAWDGFLGKLSNAREWQRQVTSICLLLTGDKCVIIFDRRCQEAHKSNRLSTIKHQVWELEPLFN